MIGIYADDTVFYYKNEDLLFLWNKLQSDFNVFHNWCKANKLILNVHKTKSMLFSSKSTSTTLVNNVSIGDREYKFVQNFTYLGITLDTRLSFV